MRTHQPEQQQPDRQRGGDVRSLPAEFLLQRQDEHARRTDGACRDQHGEECRAGDDPAIVDVAAGERGGKRVRH
jgi:hypothetical protein